MDRLSKWAVQEGLGQPTGNEANWAQRAGWSEGAGGDGLGLQEGPLWVRWPCPGKGVAGPLRPPAGAGCPSGPHPCREHWGPGGSPGVIFGPESGEPPPEWGSPVVSLDRGCTVPALAQRWVQLAVLSPGLRVSSGEPTLVRPGPLPCVRCGVGPGLWACPAGQRRLWLANAAPGAAGLGSEAGGAGRRPGPPSGLEQSRRWLAGACRVRGLALP